MTELAGRGGQVEVRLGAPRLRRRRALAVATQTRLCRAITRPQKRTRQGQRGGARRTMPGLSDTERHEGETMSSLAVHTASEPGNAGQVKSSTMKL